MFETVAILIVFFFIVAFGFIFYSSISKTTIKREAGERTELTGIQIAERVSHLPEIKCSSAAQDIGNCIDVLKAEAFGDLLYPESKTKEYYYDLLGDSIITIEIVYPLPSPLDPPLVLYNKTPRVIGSVSFFQIPIVLLDETDRSSRCGPEYASAKCSFALMHVGVYS